MIDFARGSQSQQDGHVPTALTWDFAKRLREVKDTMADLALCTCRNRHTTRMSGSIHSIAADGTVTPSYVCPVAGCTFHDFVRLVGWEPGHAFEVVEIET